LTLKKVNYKFKNTTLKKETIYKIEKQED
jgi:hypothetical protein